MSGNTTAVEIWKKCDSPCARATRPMMRTSWFRAFALFIFQPGKKSDDSPRPLINPVPVRRMAAVLQLQQFARPAHLPLDGVELRQRAVLVVLALDREHRAADAGQVRLDVPL